MHSGVLHVIFDYLMATALVFWLGRQLVVLSKHDVVTVIWECLRFEFRKLRHAPPRRPARKLPQAADLMVAK